jgi:transposase
VAEPSFGHVSSRSWGTRVQTNKGDAADAQAICPVAQEPEMRFVGIATEAQQEVYALYSDSVRNRVLRIGRPW